MQRGRRGRRRPAAQNHKIRTSCGAGRTFWRQEPFLGPAYALAGQKLLLTTVHDLPWGSLHTSPRCTLTEGWRCRSGGHHSGPRVGALGLQVCAAAACVTHALSPGVHLCGCVGLCPAPAVCASALPPLTVRVHHTHRATAVPTSQVPDPECLAGQQPAELHLPVLLARPHLPFWPAERVHCPPPPTPQPTPYVLHHAPPPLPISIAPSHVPHHHHTPCTPSAPSGRPRTPAAVH